MLTFYQCDGLYLVNASWVGHKCEQTLSLFFFVLVAVSEVGHILILQLP